MLLTHLEKVSIDKRFLRCLDVGEGGEHGMVFRIGESQVAKFPVRHNRCGFRKFSSSSKSKRRIMAESNVCKALYKKGYPVPEPRGMFSLPIKRYYGIGCYDAMPSKYGLLAIFHPFPYYPAFVMEYINGKPIYELPNKYELHNEGSKILKRMEEEGFVLGAEAKMFPNMLWDEDRKRIVIIDFSTWAFK